MSKHKVLSIRDIKSKKCKITKDIMLQYKGNTIFIIWKKRNYWHNDRFTEIFATITEVKEKALKVLQTTDKHLLEHFPEN